jgi:hypothetical protein
LQSFEKGHEEDGSENLKTRPSPPVIKKNRFAGFSIYFAGWYLKQL